MIEKKIKIVQNEIAETCAKCGRDVSEIRLVAVSKTKPIDDIYSAKNAGLVDFGENKALEFRDKAKEIDNNIVWHFIGHLQTNKIKYVIPYAHFLHSVDSIKLAEEINKRAVKLSKIQKIFLEFNTSGEDTKFGITSFEDGLKLVEFCKKQTNLELTGLMTMAPYTNNESLIRKSFSKLRNYLNMFNNRGFNLKELSMGMSNDFQPAIEEGATIVRVGSKIFGERVYT